MMKIERKELELQKQISDTWVKFVYLLMESTLEYCDAKDILFDNLDEYAQTLLLRDRANALRER
jgi:hypothetical protein